MFVLVLESIDRLLKLGSKCKPWHCLINALGGLHIAALSICRWLVYILTTILFRMLALVIGSLVSSLVQLACAYLHQDQP